MSPQKKLKDIKDGWPQRKQFPNACFAISASNLDFLISRIDQLESALREPVTVENVCDGCGLSTTIIDEPMHLSKALKEMP